MCVCVCVCVCVWNVECSMLNVAIGSSMSTQQDAALNAALLRVWPDVLRESHTAFLAICRRTIQDRVLHPFILQHPNQGQRQINSHSMVVPRSSKKESKSQKFTDSNHSRLTTHGNLHHHSLHHISSRPTKLQTTAMGHHPPMNTFHWQRQGQGQALGPRQAPLQGSEGQGSGRNG